MRAQRSQAGHVFSGTAELFELYLLHVFHTFADVPLAELAQGIHLRLVGQTACLRAAAWPLVHTLALQGDVIVAKERDADSTRAHSTLLMTLKPAKWQAS